MMVMNSEESAIYPELKKIENGIQVLKILLLRSRKTPRKIVKLEGLLKGEVNDEDIEEAKNLFSNSVIEMYVADAHALLWFLLKDPKLVRKP